MSVLFTLVAGGALGCFGVGCCIVSYRFARSYLIDPLTGLPRHINWFQQRLNSLGKSSTGSWAIVVNLNRFSTIRYCLGREVSDRLLVDISVRLKTTLLRNEQLMRSGEDEFTIVLPGRKDSPRALQLANTLRRLMRRPFWVSEQPLFVTLSIGIASSEGHEFHDAIGAARVMMYRAKATGQSAPAVFDTNVRAQSIARLRLEIDLRESISHSRILSATRTDESQTRGYVDTLDGSSQMPHSELGQEFRTYYQPIVSLRHRRIEGFEALIRWDHHSRGRVSPVDFIPVCEETGLIVPLGYWILQEACCQARQWKLDFPKTHPQFISVNVSGKQLQMPDFLDRLSDIARKSGIRTQYLKLEITESTAMEDVEATIAVLQRLKALGLRLGVDDFGTGYSSLSYLHRLPIHTLKIDRSFVRDLEYSRESQAIAKTIVTLARTLRLKTIAEGIETDRKSTRLNSSHQIISYAVFCLKKKKNKKK